MWGLKQNAIQWDKNEISSSWSLYITIVVSIRVHYPKPEFQSKCTILKLSS